MRFLWCLKEEKRKTNKTIHASFKRKVLLDEVTKTHSVSNTTMDSHIKKMKDKLNKSVGNIIIKNLI